MAPIVRPCTNCFWVNHHLGIAYVKCGEYEKAESAFDLLLYNKSKANQIELIYYQYGMAQLLHRKGNHAEALLRILFPIICNKIEI